MVLCPSLKSLSELDRFELFDDKRSDCSVFDTTDLLQM